jgi:hypothetical protein
MYFYNYFYVFLLLCMFCTVYSVFIVFYVLCVNVYYATAIGCQPNCSYQMYHINITIYCNNIFFVIFDRFNKSHFILLLRICCERLIIIRRSQQFLKTKIIIATE